MTGSVKAFWWRGRDGTPNMGDEITPFLLRELYGTNPVLSAFDGADLLSTGSILGWIWARPSLRNRSPQRPLHVVGSGLMDARTPMEALPFLRIHSVRGHVSQELLSDAGVGTTGLVGDPGLLVPRAGYEALPRRHGTGFVPHYGHADRLDVGRVFTEPASVLSIDPRTEDLRSVLSLMSSCEYVVSQSLHGLVLADAIGVPAAWLTAGRLHSGAGLKFLDYSTTVNRPFDRLVTSRAPFTPSQVEAAAWSPDRGRLESLRRDIDTAMTAALAEIG